MRGSRGGTGGPDPTHPPPPPTPEKLQNIGFLSNPGPQVGPSSARQRNAINCLARLPIGVATIYAKTHVRTHWNENMGLFYPSYEGILMICIQNVCKKAILMCLIPILVGVIYDGIICSKTP